MPAVAFRNKFIGFRPKAVYLILALGMTVLAFQSGLISAWVGSGEQGHGILIVVLLGYLIYQQRRQLPLFGARADWRLIALSLAGLGVSLVGTGAGISTLQMYAIWLFAVAVTYAMGGVTLLRVLGVPLLIALLTFPLPNAVEVGLTAELQLLSSWIGVWLIRAFGGVVYLQGNIIDMGSFRLLVDEACAGLRYLYPLLSLGAVAGYLFFAPLWARWTLVFATIPITIGMNSLRIAVTGLLVEHYGAEHTQGFLHLFEGWVVFIAAVIMLGLLAFALLRLTRSPRPFVDGFSLDLPGLQPHRRLGFTAYPESARRPGKSLLFVTGTILAALVAIPASAIRTEAFAERKSLSMFPTQLGDWDAREHRLPLEIEKVAGATDYFYADFVASGGASLNVYLSYYASQRGGRIPHSPAVCLPGDGWSVDTLETVTLTGAQGQRFQANRLLSSKGDRRILAYYWLKQGSRTFHREAFARLDLIRYALVENRTDGALVRLVAEVGPREDLSAIDARLSEFAAELTQVLPGFVPD